MLYIVSLFVSILSLFLLEAFKLQREASGRKPPGDCRLVFVELRTINMNKWVFFSLTARLSSEMDGGAGDGPRC